MGVHAHRDLARGGLDEPGQRRLGQQVAGVWTDEVRANELSGLCIGHHLRKPVDLTNDGRLAQCPEGEAADLDLATLVTRLLLGEAKRGDLRAAEGDAR